MKNLSEFNLIKCINCKEDVSYQESFLDNSNGLLFCSDCIESGSYKLTTFCNNCNKIINKDEKESCAFIEHYYEKDNIYYCLNSKCLEEMDILEAYINSESKN